MTADNFSNRLARRLYRVAGLELDPGRPSRVYSEYDHRRGYADYHALCRSRSTRRPTSGSTPLGAVGYEFLDLLTGDQARRIVSRLRLRHELTLLKKDSKDLVGWMVDDSEFLQEVLRWVFEGPLDDRLATHFGSEYLVYWMSFSHTDRASGGRSVSFRWHCDKGPANHIKVIVYLNATEEHGGTTDFVDIEQTRTLASRGYLFGWTKARSADLREISRATGCDLKSRSVDMASGQGVVFQPGRVLHRGVAPTTGSRCALTLCLLPSPERWDAVFARTGGPVVDLSTDEKWHPHAQGLLEAVFQAR